MDTKNPLLDLRERQGLSRRDMALLLDVSYTALGYIENGTASQLPRPWREKLEAAGYPFDALSDAYQQWRKAQQSALKSAKGA